MASVHQVPIKDVRRHEDCVIFVFFFASQVENPLYAVRPISFGEKTRALAGAASTGPLLQELFELEVQVRIQIVVHREGLFLRSHAQVRRVRILGERLVDLFDINATIYVRIMIADVIQIYLRVLRRDGQPSRSHLVRRECRAHHRAFWLQLLIR